MNTLSEFIDVITVTWTEDEAVINTQDTAHTMLALVRFTAEDINGVDQSQIGIKEEKQEDIPPKFKSTGSGFLAFNTKSTANILKAMKGFEKITVTLKESEGITFSGTSVHNTYTEYTVLALFVDCESLEVTIPLEIRKFYFKMPHFCEFVKSAKAIAPSTLKFVITEEREKVTVTAEEELKGNHNTQNLVLQEVTSKDIQVKGGSISFSFGFFDRITKLKDLSDGLTMMFMDDKPLFIVLSIPGLGTFTLAIAPKFEDKE